MILINDNILMCVIMINININDNININNDNVLLLKCVMCVYV